MDILIAGGDAISRRALSLLLHTRLDLNVVGEVADDATLIELAESTGAEMILLDGELFNAKMAELTSKLHQLAARPDVIVLDSRQETKQAVLTAGADAFVWKVEAPRSLLTVMQRLGLRRGHE